ncbi:MAG: putative Ig domain-containing protein, partial [Candidatus Poseidoniales archaeon]
NISDGGAGIAGFSDAFCSLTENGTVVCWGQNEYGRINASASTSDSLEPTIVPMPLGRFATGVAVGSESACALLDNSSVVCWGDSNESRILSHWAGDGIISPRFIPGLGGSALVTQLQLAYDMACVLLYDGDMKCWGLGSWGNLGQGNTTSLSVPSSVSIIPSARSVVQIAVGGFHACALLDNNSLMCWGDNDYSQLGDGTTTDNLSGVYVELGTRTISSVGAGWLGTCVAYYEGGASCWGRNDYGMVGDGTTTARSTPVNVTGLGANTTFASLHTLFGETCGIATNGSLLCWGDNNGFQAADSYTPGIVDVGTNVSTVSVALDTDTACALLSTGEIQCWGWSGNDDNFGLNSTSSSATPVSGVTNQTHRTINGGWNIVGALPQGLQFSPANGTIWGTPVILQPQWTNYSVKVFNSAGSSTHIFSMRVIDNLPNVTYSPSNLTLTNNTASSDLPLIPTITGSGEITSWSINATLPGGLNFGTNNGTLWGTPTELWNKTAYMVWANNTGGSEVAYLNITVVDQLPNITYSPDNITLYNNTESLDLPLSPTITGDGVFLGWEISPDLPSGLNFGSDNGTIWGVATERMNMTMFTVWANNSGGASIAYLNITVIHQEPAFNYSVLDLVLVNNTQMANVSANITGGEIVSWASSPDLPVGLNLESNGNISGTPTVVQNRTMYVIWANNTGGSHLVFINITIYDPIAELDYIPENITLTRNETMANLSAIHSGIIDSWAIYPELPAGLNFTNGTISGTPEINMTRTTYTVWANNTGGAISHTINITIVEPAVVINYVPSAVVLVNNTNSTDMPMVPIIEGEGVVDTWEIWPALPSGLNFSASNGTISGIARELQVIPVNYTIWANNTGGISMFNISITIIDQLPNVTYPYDLELVNNTNSTDLPMVPIINGSGEIVTWEINATLPAGLNFSSENGTISGIARELMNKTQFTVWANNSGGSVMILFNVTVVDEVPDDIGYGVDYWLVLTRNENNSQILPMTPNLSGSGEITSWEINATLPTGLNFSTENGTIWGIPSELSLEWQYFTVYANNTGGSLNSSFAIRVIDQIPTISYDFVQLVVKNNTEMLSEEAEIGGGPFVTLEISPGLPPGMNFGELNGTIWGVPVMLSDKTEYTVWANNSGGSAMATFFIAVEDKSPKFYYLNSELVLYVGTDPVEMPLLPLSFAGEIENFSISPNLPEGLSFGQLNGTIWGSPVQDTVRIQYNITAYNPLGQYTVSINITIYDFVYDFELDPVWIANGTFMPEIIPSYRIPGAQYSVEPKLPYGLSVNPNNGVISGRPNETIDLRAYTLYANISGYSLTVPLNL